MRSSCKNLSRSVTPGTTDVSPVARQALEQETPSSSQKFESCPAMRTNKRTHLIGEFFCFKDRVRTGRIGYRLSNPHDMIIKNFT